MKPHTKHRTTNIEQRTPKSMEVPRETLEEIRDAMRLRYDPFAGDRDVDVKMHSVKIITLRKPHDCYMGMCPPDKPHNIERGRRARFEKALVDGEWCSYYICLDCIDKWLKESGIWK